MPGPGFRKVSTKAPRKKRVYKKREACDFAFHSIPDLVVRGSGILYARNPASGYGAKFVTVKSMRAATRFVRVDKGKEATFELSRAPRRERCHGVPFIVSPPF